METKKQNRWLIAVAGVLMQLVLGTVYAWSVFKKPFMAAHDWNDQQVGLTFTIVIFCIGFAAAFGGKFVDKAGARKVATLAAILYGIGVILAGLAAKTGSLALLYIGFGFIGGVGNGLGYITPIAVLVRWFPDKRGVITGLAVMGFGLGAAFMGQIAPLIIPNVGLENAFYIFGVIFLILLLVAAQYLNNPPAGWKPEGLVQQKSTTTTAAPVININMALKMPQFYILFGVLCLNISAGIALLSNIVPMAESQLKITAVSAGTVLLFGSIFNGLGRLFWASLSDKLGRKNTFILILATQIPAFIILPHITSYLLFIVVCCYILACYGGGFATMPAFAADTFGATNLGSIYGKILIAWSVAGVIGPMVMEYIKSTSASGKFDVALYIAAGLLALGLIINLIYKKPKLIEQKSA